MIPNRLHYFIRLTAVLLLLLPSVSAFAACGGVGWFCPMSVNTQQSCCNSEADHNHRTPDPQSSECDNCTGCNFQSVPESTADHTIIMPAPSQDTVYANLTQILEESHPATTPIAPIVHLQALQHPPQTLFVLHQSFLN